MYTVHLYCGASFYLHPMYTVHVYCGTSFYLHPMYTVHLYCGTLFYLHLMYTVHLYCRFINIPCALFIHTMEHSLISLIDCKKAATLI